MRADIDPEGVERRVIAQMVELSGKQILEVGCGLGRETAFLVRPDNHVVAIDPDRLKLIVASEILPQVRFEPADMSDLLDLRRFGLVRAYDLIVFSMALHHIPDRARKIQALLNAQEMRASEGEVLIIEPATTGSVTELICAFDQDEVVGLADAQDILENTGVIFRERETATARWVFPDYASLLDFFCTLFRTGNVRLGREKVTGIAINAALTRMGLAGATELQDDIKFYLL